MNIKTETIANSAATITLSNDDYMAFKDQAKSIGQNCSTAHCRKSMRLGRTMTND